MDLTHALARIEQAAMVERMEVATRRLDRLAGAAAGLALAADALPRSLFDRYDFGACSGVPVFDHAPMPPLRASPGCPVSRLRRLIADTAQRPCLDGGSLDYG